jgi:endoglucanase
MKSVLVPILLAVISLSACAEPVQGLLARLKGGVEPAPRADRIGRHNPPGPAVKLDLRLLVDQFGYRPADRKVAVVRSADVGYDAGPRFAPAPVYEVRRSADQAVAFSGELTPWKDGASQNSSGDIGWWFDFSTLSEPGEYYVYDPKHAVRSAVFRIDAKVYREPLKAAVRTFFYQRSGFAKKTPHAEACWTDAPAYVGRGQDTEARDIRDRDNPTTARDVSGGWFDAGDTNKYVTFASHAVHQLLTAYQLGPAAFTDDYNLPESGNGVPDVIDEVKWQIEWLRKMQNADGTSALKVGVLKLKDVGTPGADRLPRYYIASCTSATIANAGMLAHAAAVYRGVPQLAALAPELATRAARGFEAYLRAPAPQTDCDDGTIWAGDADLPADIQQGLAAQAALYLYAATGEARWHDYLRAHYRTMYPYKDIGWSRYYPQMGDALLFYTRLPNADVKLAQQIRDDKIADARQGWGIYGESDADLYRNFLHDEQYHWGSSIVRAAYGNTNLDLVAYDLDRERHASYASRAQDTLHYFHGVNPLGLVYLTNMYRYGATHALNEIYHVWFWEGTKFSNALADECGPAPGFVSGGPNAAAQAGGVPAQLVPPVGQPAQKAYRDTNRSALSAWVLSEPSNNTQAAYIRLLAGLQ